MKVNRRILTEGHLGGDGPYAKPTKDEKCILKDNGQNLRHLHE